MVRCHGAGAATTDDEGRFRLDDVPTSDLGFAFRLGGQWKLVMGPSCCLELEPKGALELGDVALGGPG